ncbi:glycoside hydrolase family 28 protein [Peniophora sp. CONT]|nr:glycoside hydrolase family 28 protein [Peniophora sp. CONT]
MRVQYFAFLLLLLFDSVLGSDCVLNPLGEGQDDTDQVLTAIDVCGTDGTITLNVGDFNITRKMTWNLVRSKVDMFGYLNFVADFDYWLQENSTYRVVFIQSQASWFVVTGSDFVIDAHNQGLFMAIATRPFQLICELGGIQGNGQPWWNHFAVNPRHDGDGRPIALTVYRATNGTVKDFLIQSQPFWCNTVAESDGVVYDGMLCNATNTNPEFFGKNIVQNTDGLDTYRSTNVQVLNWDITNGDDCIAIKGNTTNLLINNITCRAGGIAFGSLGQYVNLTDIVDNVTISNVLSTRINSTLEPNGGVGVYLKTWVGSIKGVPPISGGGGSGFVSNARFINVTLDDVDSPTLIDQLWEGNSSDIPSKMQISNLTWENWSGTAAANSTLVSLDCSPAFPCENLTFINFNVSVPSGEGAEYECSNAMNVTGITC